MLTLKWEFYTLPMVRALSQCLLTFTYTDTTRRRRTLLPPRRHPIRSTPPLVILLPRLARRRHLEFGSFVGCVWVQDARRCVSALLAFLTFTSKRDCIEILIEIGQASAAQNTTEDSTFSQILRSKTVHYLAFFTLVYVGVEVTIGGGYLALSTLG